MMQPQDFVPTSKEDWAKSDIYHNKFLIPEDPVLDYAVKNSQDKELPDIAVSAAQGKFLNLVARSIRARRILEVGTLGGYSTIWLARALPADGKLVSLEIDQLRADVARDNLDHAGLMNKVEIKVGPAADTLKALDSSEPFDLVFIDADKPNNLTYFLEAKRLTRQGAVILVDNVVRWAKVALEPEDTNDRNVLGVRKLLNHLKDDREVDGTTLGLVGDKGYDGILYAIKK